MPANDAKELRELEFDLQSEDESTRANALMQLSRRKRDLAVLDVLKKVIAEDNSFQVRGLAKKLYAEVKEALAGDIKSQVSIVGPDGAVDAANLYEALNSDEMEIRLEALRQVQERKDKRALTVCLKALSRETDPWVIATLVKCIGVLGDTGQIGTLQPFLKHSDVRIVANTVEALEMIGSDLVIPILIPLLSYPDHRVQGNAVKGMLKFDRAEAIATLEKMADNASVDTREAALYCLGLVEGPEVEPILLRMFTHENAPELAVKEGQVLKRLGGKATITAASRLLNVTMKEKAVAARDVQREVAKRLGISIEEVVSLELAAQKEIERARQSAAIRHTIRSKPIKPPQPKDVALAWARSHPLPIAGIAVLVAAPFVLWTLAPEWREADLLPAVKAPSVLLRASHATELRELQGKSVDLRGIVRVVDPVGQSVLVISGNRPVLARLAAPDAGAPGGGAGSTAGGTLAALQIGQIVQISGTLAGRTQLGAIYIDATHVGDGR